MRLSGKVAIVTGTSPNIGGGIAEGLAAEGAAIVAVDARADNANDCATQPVSVSFTDPVCGSIGPASLTYTKVTTVTVQ